MTARNRLAAILLLGTTQTLGWASSFYLPASLATASLTIWECRAGGSTIGLDLPIGFVTAAHWQATVGLERGLALPSTSLFARYLTGPGKIGFD